MQNHDPCYCCGYEGSTKAHVRDRSDCEKNGIRDHEYHNIVPLCANCHYSYFDEGRMGIIENDGLYYFILLEKNNVKRLVQSRYTLNILPEYIRWKNIRCRAQLHMELLHKPTQFEFLNLNIES
jgi:hypothetical protein